MEDANNQTRTPSPAQPPTSPEEARRRQSNRQDDAARKYTASKPVLEELKPDNKRHRTEAQREASRRNGVKSRGPVTAEGKARSSLNAVKHGLRSVGIWLPGDVEGYERRFKTIHRQLTAELKPRTFSQCFMVELLANDYLQRAVVIELQRAAMQIPAAADRTKAYREVKAGERDIRHMRRIASRINAGLPPDCTDKTAVRLAGVISTFVQSVREDIRPSEDRTPPEEMDAFEQKEEADLQQLWSGLQPVMTQLTDAGILRSLLGGWAAAAPDVLSQVAVVLARLAAHRTLALTTSNDVVQKVDVARRGHMCKLADYPENLMRLQRYAAMLERSIARRLAEFERSMARRVG